MSVKSVTTTYGAFGHGPLAVGGPFSYLISISVVFSLRLRSLRKFADHLTALLAQLPEVLITLQTKHGAYFGLALWMMVCLLNPLEYEFRFRDYLLSNQAYAAQKVNFSVTTPRTACQTVDLGQILRHGVRIEMELL